MLPVNRGPSAPLTRALPFIMAAALTVTVFAPARAVTSPTLALSQQAVSYNATANTAQVQVTAVSADAVAPWQYVVAVAGATVNSGQTSDTSVTVTLTTNCSITAQSVTVSITGADGAGGSAAGTLDRSLCPPPPNLPHAGDLTVTGPNLSEAMFVDRLRAVGSPALAEGHQIYLTLKGASINLAFALGTFQAESSGGTKGYAVTTKNWGNILYHSWEDVYGAVPYAPGNGYTYASFPSWTAGIQAYAQLLTWYKESGYLTVSSASAHWLGTIEGSTRHLTYLNNITAVMSLLLNAAGGTYVALPPARLVDTRIGLGLSGALVSGVPQTFQVAGLGGVPSNASAVTGILTVNRTTSGGYVALGPVPTATPSTSTLNFPQGDTRANGVTVTLGAGGTLSAVFKGTNGTTTALIFDVTGYFLPDTSGATYVALPPARLVDTRIGLGLPDALVSGVPQTFQVAGLGGVPSNASAVTGILTVNRTTSGGYVALGPVPTATPSTSTLNFPQGDTRANGVTVTLGAGGTLSAVFRGTDGTTTALIFDVTGYFLPDSSGATYVALPPARLVDTRIGIGLSGALVSGVPRTFQVTGRGGVPANAVAVTGNLTVDRGHLGRLRRPGPGAHGDPVDLDPQLPPGRHPGQRGHGHPGRRRHPVRDVPGHRPGRPPR